MNALAVRDLQRLLESLLLPLEAAGATEKTRTEMARLAGCLAPFQDATLTAFSEFLENAQKAVATGAWPAPGKRATSSRGSKGPKPTVADMAQKIMELYERAAADQHLEFPEIDAFVDSFKPMTIDELKELAKQVDVTVAARETKNDILDKMRESIKSRKSRTERTSHGSEGMAVQHEEPVAVNS